MHHWHLVELGNDALTEVRQRVSQERHGRRGRKSGAAWAHLGLLLPAGDRLSMQQLERLREVLATDSSIGESGGVWGGKERG